MCIKLQNWKVITFQTFNYCVGTTVVAKRLFDETQLTPTKNEDKKRREGKGIKIQIIIPLISFKSF